MTYFEGDLVVPRDVGDRYCPSRIVVAERRHHDQSRTRRSETDDMLSALVVSTVRRWFATIRLQFDRATNIRRHTLYDRRPTRVCGAGLLHCGLNK